MNAEFNDVIGAAPANISLGKEHSAIKEAVVKFVKDDKSTRQRKALSHDWWGAMKAIIHQFLERGRMGHSDSEWGLSAFVGPQKTKGFWRLVVDSRGFEFHNRDGPVWPPNDQSHFAASSAKRVFSVLAFELRFHQMKYLEELQDCTNVSTPLVIYKGFVMPMGVKNGDTAFQHLLDDIMKDCRNFTRPFVDDIIVSSGGDTYEEGMQKHVKHLRLELQRLREKDLAVSAKKANIFVEQVEFSGHVVGYSVKRSIAGKIRCLEK